MKTGTFLTQLLAGLWLAVGLLGFTNPARAVLSKLPMDMANPLALSWPSVVNAVAYDVYLGTASTAVATATTNTAGVYQGRTGATNMNISGIVPNTAYYWRVDSVATSGAITTGTMSTFTTGAPMVDSMQDTWVATDALNRSLPGLADCGSPRTNRPTGMFYFLWQSKEASYPSATNRDVSRYLSAHPYTNPHNPWGDNPLFQTVKNGTMFWWGQPALGYYNANDPWMLRRQIALLTHAGIDVLIFDYSNAEYYGTQLDALCDMIRQMRFEGFKCNLKITFLTYTLSGKTVTHLYNTVYGPGDYSDLWYYWQGKPLILGYVNGSGGSDTVPSDTVKNFFTWRVSWTAVATNQLHDQWQWSDAPTPQNWGYHTRSDLPEEVPVLDGGWASLGGNIGHSHSNNAQPDYDRYQLPLQRTMRLGVFFKEQMNYGLKYDPQFLFITGWNEWIAGSWFATSTSFPGLMLADHCPVGGFYFVDEYNEEYNRDIEPMHGGHTDNYYFQMVGQNRLRKGVRPVPAASAPQTINPAGGFSQWANVAPAYYDPVGDTLWRNYASAITDEGTYTNYTGRNDFTVLKVARDANNFYFFAQCNSNLTSYTGSNWMVLFLDTDQNHLTGWEGYDYAVNLGPRTAATTTLSQNNSTADAWTWTAVRSDIAYTVSGNQLMLTLPRASLGLGADPVQFDFHWADNFQTNDIADFGVDGDSAPDRRFNYRYITTTNTEVVLLSDDFENGRQSIWGVTWTNGSRWSLASVNAYAGIYCAMGSYAATGQSNLIASVSTLGYGSFRLSFHYKLTSVLNAQNLQLSYLTTNGWVPIRQLSRDEYYPTNQSWAYNEQQNVWLNFTDTRYNAGPDARFFTTNFAFRIDASALTASGQKVYVDAVSLAADTQMPAAVAPQTWQTQDIGNAGNAGYVATNGTTFTVSGSGMDIGNNGDAFRFLYQTRSGDGQLTARVTSITPTDPWAKAGVMIRESLDSGSRHAMMALTPGHGVSFQQRVTPLGASTLTTLGPSVAPPYWVRVVRSGTTFAGYVSTTGASWTQVGTTNIPGFNSTALWGLAVTAHNNTLTNVATFDNVTAVLAPVASFTPSATNGPAPSTVIFTNTSLGIVTNALWSFGDGTTNSTLAATVANTYTIAGIYDVSLTVSGPLGTGATNTLIVITNAAPEPAFATDKQTGQRPLAVCFTNLSHCATNYTWTFGDGTTSHTSSTNALWHTYNAAGTYSVCLTATGLGGTSTSCSNNLIVVTNPPPNVAAYGDNTWLQCGVPVVAANAIAIAAGAWHTLALQEDGTVVAWGDDSSSQCEVPATLQDTHDAVTIAAGGYHSLAIKLDGTVVAWGADDYGQIHVPAGLAGVIGIAAGTWHSVALRTNGTVSVWGDNSFGQTNQPPGLTNVTAVAAGGNHTLALKAGGTVVAWGENTDAEGNNVGQSIVPWGLTGVVAIGAGEYHSLAVKGDGTVVAWGDNSEGQCSVPLGLTNVVAVAGGGGHSVALKADGTVVAWGADWNGECDLPLTLPPAVGIAAGEYHTAVLLEDNPPVLPRLLNPAWEGSQFSALLQTLNRKNYALEFVDSLATTNWTGLCTNAGNGALKMLTDSTATGAQRFYRVRQWQAIVSGGAASAP